MSHFMENQREYYSDCFKQHGDSPQGVNWSSEERQRIMFDALLGSFDVDGKKILDIGCGVGHFLEYLQAKGKVLDYTGVDLVEGMLECARRKHSDARFIHADILADSFEAERYDMVFICGVFNVKVKKHRDFVENTIRRAWDMCDGLLAFNMISNYVDYEEPHLYYANPLSVFHFCKKLTRRVCLLHDYLPFEFTVTMNKIPFSPECYKRMAKKTVK